MKSLPHLPTSPLPTIPIATSQVTHPKHTRARGPVGDGV